MSFAICHWAQQVCGQLWYEWLPIWVLRLGFKVCHDPQSTATNVISLCLASIWGSASRLLFGWPTLARRTQRNNYILFRHCGCTWRSSQTGWRGPPNRWYQHPHLNVHHCANPFSICIQTMEPTTRKFNGFPATLREWDENSFETCETNTGPKGQRLRRDMIWTKLAQIIDGTIC